MPFDHIDQISAWLAEAGIDRFELTGPEQRLVLGRAEPQGDEPDDKAAEIEPADAEGRARHRFAAKAPGVGILLHSHPMQQAPLAPCGSLVRAGQTVALLQIGALLLPVEAPCDGVVTAVLLPSDALVGYGSDIIELCAAGYENQHED